MQRLAGDRTTAGEVRAAEDLGSGGGSPPAAGELRDVTPEVLLARHQFRRRVRRRRHAALREHIQHFTGPDALTRVKGGPDVSSRAFQHGGPDVHIPLVGEIARAPFREGQ